MQRNFDLALLALRLMLGLILLYHGVPKIVDFPQTLDAFTKIGVPAPGASLVFAILAEVMGGLLIVLGAWTDVAAPFVILDMLGAILTVHWKAGFDFTEGGYEHPLTVLVMALVLLLAGPGRYVVGGSARRAALQGRRDRRG